MIISISLLEYLYQPKGLHRLFNILHVPLQAFCQQADVGLSTRGFQQGLYCSKGSSARTRDPASMVGFVMLRVLKWFPVGKPRGVLSAPWGSFKKTVGCAFAHTQLFCPTSGVAR